MNPLDRAIEAAGGKVGSGVSSKTSYVIAGNPNESSTKLTKARDLNIPVLSIPEFQELLNA